MNIPDSPILTGEEALSTALPFSHVVLLPYTSRLVIEGGSLHTELSWPSEIALHAGIIALNQHEDAKLIVIGEDDHEGLDSTTVLTVRRATNTDDGYGVHIDSIWPIPHLNNGKLLNGTDRQIAGAAERLATVTSPNVLVAAFKDHLQRVIKRSQEVNLLAKFVSVEEVLRAADVHIYDDMLSLIAGIAHSERRKRIAGRIIGQTGRKVAATLMDTGLVSHVYLDIDEAKGELVEMSAKERRKQLERQLLAVNSAVATK